MVSFGLFAILVTALVDTVSARAVDVSRRDVPEVIQNDLGGIFESLSNLGASLGNLGSGDASAVSNFTGEFQNLIDLVASAAIDTEGLPVLSEDDLGELSFEVGFIGLLTADLVDQLTANATLIRSIPGLEKTLSGKLDTTESVVAALGNGLISLLPNDEKASGVEQLYGFLQGIEGLRNIFN